MRLQIVCKKVLDPRRFCMRFHPPVFVMTGDGVSVDTLIEISSNDAYFSVEDFDELEGELCIDHTLKIPSAS